MIEKPLPPAPAESEPEFDPDVNVPTVGELIPPAPEPEPEPLPPADLSSSTLRPYV